MQSNLAVGSAGVNGDCGLRKPPATGIPMPGRGIAAKTGLALIPDASHDRNVILGDGVVRDLIAEAYSDSREFGLFVELAAVTGARPRSI